MAAISEFVLKNDDTEECVDISGGKAVAGMKMGLYSIIHHGPNQSWFLGATGQIVSVLDPELCLGVSMRSQSQGTDRVLLLKKNQPHTEWKITGIRNYVNEITSW
jgi:hypothetical protein